MATETVAAEIPAWPDWLGDHHELLAFLRRERFVVGMDREVRLVRLLDELREARVALDSDDDVRRWLAPALCVTPLDQARFGELLTRYADERRAPARAGLVDRIKKTAAHAVTTRGEPPFSRPVAVALFVGLLLMIALAVWYAWDSAPVRLASQPQGTSNTVVPVPAAFAEYRFAMLQAFLALAVICSAIILLVWRRGRRIGLSRQITDQVDRGKFVDLVQATRSLFPPVRFRRLVRIIAAHRQVPSTVLHARDTIRATIAAAGRVRLRFGRRPALPEHLFLVERSATFDHVGVLGDLIAERLRLGDVHLARYEFDQDPRLLRQYGTDRMEALRDVAARYIGQRAIVVSDGAKFLGFDGLPRRWVEGSFEGFAPAILLTPVPIAAWGHRERTLARLGVRIFPATGNGIEALAGELARGDTASSSPSFAGARQGTDVVGRIERGRERWLSDIEPEKTDVDDLVLTLRAWLGDEGFALLAGIVLFPQIQAEVTLALARALAPEPRELAVDLEILAELSRLPWLRHGRMPDWLRVALLRALPPATARRLREAYSKILAEARVSEGSEGLEITRKPAVSLGFSELLGRTQEHERHERITWDFLSGRELELEVPSAFARLLRSRLDLFEWVVLGLGVFIAFVIVPFGKTLWHLLEPLADHLVAVIGEPGLRWATLTAIVLSIYLRIVQALDMGFPPHVPSITVAGRWKSPEWHGSVPGVVPLALAGAALFGGLVLAASVGAEAATNLVGGAVIACLAIALIRPGPTAAARNRTVVSVANLPSGDRWWERVPVTIGLYLLMVSALALPPAIVRWGLDAETAGIGILSLLMAVLLTRAIASRLRLGATEIIALPIAAVAAIYLTAFCVAEVGALAWPPAADVKQSVPEYPKVTLVFAAAAFGPPAAFLSILIGFRRCRLLTGATTAPLVAAAVSCLAVAIVATAIADILIWMLAIAIMPAAGFVTGGAVAIWRSLPPEHVPSYKLRRSGRLAWIAVLLLFGSAFCAVSALWNMPATSVENEFLVALATAASPILFLRQAIRNAFPELGDNKSVADRWASDIPHWDAGGNVWILALAPVLMLFLSQRYTFGPATVGFSEFWLPIAAWLGARHGKRGFQVVAIGAAPLVLGIGFAGFRLPGDFGLYFAALLICRIFGQSGYRAECLAANQMPLRSLAFLFLALPATPGLIRSFGAVDLTPELRLDSYLWAVLVVIGLSAAPLRGVVLSLCAATIGGVLLHMAGAIQRFEGLAVGYALVGPGDILTGLTALWVGRLVRERLPDMQMQTRRLTEPIRDLLSGQSPWTLPALLAALSISLLGSMVQLEMPGLGVRSAWISFGSAIASALLLFACGAIGGIRGMIGAIVVWLAANLLPPMFLYDPIAAPGSSPTRVQPMSLGGITLLTPASFTSLRYTIGPGVSLTWMDLLFAVFGWRLSRYLRPVALREPPASSPTASSSSQQPRLEPV